MSSALRLAVIGGDGTGPEVVAEGLKVLGAAARKFDIEVSTEDFNVSGDRYLARGGDPKTPSIPVITSEEIQGFRRFDAIYLGAIGHPDIAPGILEKGLLLRMRFELDQYINLRPVKLYPGVDCPLKDKGPKDIDFVVVRENTEDLYCGAGGSLRRGSPQEIATQESITTRFGVERCCRYAFELARQRKARGYKGMLTLVHKTNVLTYVGDLWFRTFEEVGRADYPDIQRDYNHVDACCMWFVKNPEYYDVVVTSNLFGDIITDLGAMIQGGMGIAAGGNLNPDPGGVSMFEPIGGSATKYTGKNVINPMAAIGAMAMLLQQTGRHKSDESLTRAGDAVEAAIAQACPRLPSLSAGRMGMGTTEVGDLVVSLL